MSYVDSSFQRAWIYRDDGRDRIVVSARRATAAGETYSDFLEFDPLADGFKPNDHLRGALTWGTGYADIDVVPMSQLEAVCAEQRQRATNPDFAAALKGGRPAPRARLP